MFSLWTVRGKARPFIGPVLLEEDIGTMGASAVVNRIEPEVKPALPLWETERSDGARRRRGMITETCESLLEPFWQGDEASVRPRG